MSVIAVLHGKTTEHIPGMLPIEYGRLLFRYCHVLPGNRLRAMVATGPNHCKVVDLPLGILQDLDYMPGRSADE